MVALAGGMGWELSDLRPAFQKGCMPAGHQEGPAISKGQGPTATQRHLWAIVNGHLVTHFLCSQASNSAQNYTITLNVSVDSKI